MQLSNDAAQAKASVQDLQNVAEKKAVVRDLHSELFPDSSRGRTVIWVALLVGLFLIAGISVILAANLDPEKDSAAYLALASAVVAGVIGLFVKSPVS